MIYLWQIDRRSYYTQTTGRLIYTFRSLHHTATSPLARQPHRQHDREQTQLLPLLKIAASSHRAPPHLGPWSQDGTGPLSRYELALGHWAIPMEICIKHQLGVIRVSLLAQHRRRNHMSAFVGTAQSSIRIPGYWISSQEALAVESRWCICVLIFVIFNPFN